MAEETLSARLVEIESMLERSRRRFEEGSRLVEEAQQLMGEIQQALIGSPKRVSPDALGHLADNADPVKGMHLRHSRTPLAPPQRDLARRQMATGGTLVAFESPRRVPATLALLAEIDPEREVAVCRELTKAHEEVVRGRGAIVENWLEEKDEPGSWKEG